MYIEDITNNDLQVPGMVCRLARTYTCSGFGDDYLHDWLLITYPKAADGLLTRCRKLKLLDVTKGIATITMQ